MSTQYLSFGVADPRHHSDQDPALLRTVELERAGERRGRRHSHEHAGLRLFRR